MGESIKHRQLKQIALRWVQKTGCIAFACEINWGWISRVDVAGIKANGDVYIIEAKASNADLRSDTQGRKSHRQAVSTRIDFLYYIIADGVDTTALDPRIGLLDERGRVARNARRRPRKKILKHVVLISRNLLVRVAGVLMVM